MENIVRKGAWTKEEDMLLTECIQQYGEGRWYLVPARAGLKRCRKSCRMRWLNYLKPNLKRGSFAEDEVDLVLRMHKLLGNRWSLIAGRLPGRTANDVKNFWNTHICKKPKMATETCRDVIKPQPQNLSMSRLQYSNDKNVKNKNASSSNLQLSQEQMCSSSALALQQDKDQSIEWWRNLLQLSQINGEEDPAAMLPTSSPPQEDSMAGFFADFDVWLNI